MAQFAGYVLPGSVFIAFGLKWSLDATTDPKLPGDDCVEDNRSSSRGSRRGVTNTRRKKCCRFRNWPMEGITKLAITAIGIAASLVAAYPNGELKFVGDILYATVYLFFALSGLVDVLVFYCPYTMPFGLDKFSLFLAFSMEGLMFNLHLSHQSFMEQHVHILLVCAIFACAFASIIEIVLPWSRIVRFARAFFTLVHGSWYIQSGFILFNPNQSVSVAWTSSEDYNSALIWISLTYAWHCAGALVILLILMALSRRHNLPPPPPVVESFEPQPQHRSCPSIPHCHFSSLSNYGDFKA